MSDQPTVRPSNNRWDRTKFCDVVRRLELGPNRLCSMYAAAEHSTINCPERPELSMLSQARAFSPQDRFKSHQTEEFYLARTGPELCSSPRIRVPRRPPVRAGLYTPHWAGRP